ncbi:MAG: NADH-quinone oxidoreductase subunit M [Rickettsiales bacterium]|nr:NADH-quinone oxidoreductase subunit M [Rickettsiales bacterium]
MGILSTLILLPVAGAFLIFLLARGASPFAQRLSRVIALVASLVTLGLSVLLWLRFDVSSASFQFVEKYVWLETLNIQYYLGIDGISLFMVLLTALLQPICILASWHSIEKRVAEYMIAFCILESLVIGVFCALDAMLFYVFFEAVLIPMYLIIGIWGGQNRIYASFKFFLYTLAGSVLFLVALLYLYFKFGTMEIPLLMDLAPTLSLDVQKMLWIGMFVAFAVKVPMWPVHTWLPDAHVQAPTAGSVILAGILLKMGGYGFLRFSLPMLPQASIAYADFVYILSVIAVIYTSLVALRQQDMKKLIAYSSVAHMGFVTLGLFAFNQQGVEGGIIQMISHGVVSGALFLCVGVVYDRLHSREIERYGGLVHIMPRYALLFMLFTMASVGLPATSGFVGEFLVLVGIFQVDHVFALLAASGMVLGAAYALWLYRRIVFGELVKADLKHLPDLTALEKLTFAPLVAMVIWMGVYPLPFFKAIGPSVHHLLEHIDQHTHNNFNELAEAQP